MAAATAPISTGLSLSLLTLLSAGLFLQPKREISVPKQPPRPMAPLAPPIALPSPMLVLPPVAAPRPVVATPGVLRVRAGRTAAAPLHIRNNGEMDQLVKIFNVADQREEMLVYARASQGVDVKLPLGTYEVRFAAGRTWYGLQFLFGSQTRFARLEQQLTFRRKAGAIEGPSRIELALTAAKGRGPRQASIERSEF